MKSNVINHLIFSFCKIILCGSCELFALLQLRGSNWHLSCWLHSVACASKKKKEKMGNQIIVMLF